MEKNEIFDVIIIGGSYAGLQAAMTLGRALRKVLVIDSGKPCNRKTPQSHNFLTRDGETPAQIALTAQEQLLKYKTIAFWNDKAIIGKQSNAGFKIGTESGKIFKARKLLFTSGIKDLMPEIPGFLACWGISVIHCPYCHGFEVSGKPTGVLGNGEIGFEMARMISNWTGDLTLFTHGKSLLTEEQDQQLKAKGIKIIDTEIQEITHQNGQIKNLLLEDGNEVLLTALYARIRFQQHCPIPELMGCELTDTGHIKVDAFFKTTVAGIYAAGDNISPMRSIGTAVAAGMGAGAFINKELIDASFIT